MSCRAWSSTQTGELADSQDGIPEDTVNPQRPAVSKSGKDTRFTDVAGTVPGRLHRRPRPVLEPVMQVLSLLALGAIPPFPAPGYSTAGRSRPCFPASSWVQPREAMAETGGWGKQPSPRGISPPSSSFR